FELVGVPFNLTTFELNNGTNNGYNPPSLPANCILSIFRYNGSRFEETVNDNGVWTPAIGDESFTKLESARGYWFETNSQCNVSFAGKVPTSNITKKINTTFSVNGWYSPYSPTLGNVTAYGDPIKVQPAGAVTDLFRYNASKASSNPQQGGFQGVHYFSSYGWWPFFGDEDFNKLEPGKGYYFRTPNANSTNQVNWTMDPTFS
ncbi:hypothetical protein D6817_03910, partial [Candidatus Pacearchaeota archaeon]